MQTEEQIVVAWEMTKAEWNYMGNLPEVIDLWRARSLGEEDEGVFYLSSEEGENGFRALAHSAVCSVLERVAVRRARVIAVDFDRCCAQVVLDA